MKADKIVFDEIKMRKLAENDRYVNFLIEDLKSRGHDEKYAYKIAFNSIILENYEMESVYKEI